MLSMLFESYQKNNLDYDEEAYEKLLEKNQEQVQKKNLSVNDEKILNYIKKNVSNSDKIDFDLLRSMLASREEKEK